MPKRRKVLLGLGTVALGSGVVLSQAAFTGGATDVSTNLQFVVARELRVRGPEAGDEVGADVEIVSTDADHIDFEDIPVDDLPKATVDEWDSENPETNINGDLTVKVASNFTTHDLEALFSIENFGGETKEVGISFRDSSEGHGYGADVDTSVYNEDSDEGLSRTKVQEIYQFKANDELISPDPTGGDKSTESFDNPGGAVSIAPAETVDITLEVDHSAHQGAIVDAAEVSGDPFNNPGTGTVDLLDKIWVGIDPDIEDS